MNYNPNSEEVKISRGKKRVLMSNPNKHPITQLAYVNTLSYLVSGSSEGELTIWSNNEIKKSIHLYKSSINQIKVVARPRDEKIPQQLKIKPLNKYELTKEGELLDILIKEDGINANS
jgi:hypothetical protein